MANIGFVDTVNVEAVSIKRSSCKSVEELDSVVKENPFVFVTELLESNSLVQINHGGGKGALNTVSVRGLTSNHTNVLWNGININSLTLGAFNFGGVPSGVSDAMSLIKGNSASDVNQVSIGGAVVMQSELKWNIPLSYSIGSEIGSFGSLVSHSDVSFSKNKWVSRVKYSHSQAENDYGFQNFKKIGKPTEKQVNAAFYSKNLIISNGWRNKGKDLVFINHTWFGIRFSEIAPVYNYNTNPVAFTGDSIIRSSTSIKKAFNKLLISFDHGLNHQRYLYDDANYLIHTHYITNVNQFRFKAKYSNTNWDILGFNEFQNQRATNNQYDKVQHRNLNLIKLNAIRSMLHKKLKVHGAFVLNSVLKGETVPIWVMGYKYSNKGLIFNGGGGSHFRVATFNDLYWPEGGNEDLKSERGWNIEQSIGYGKTVKKLEFNISTEFYYSIVSNWMQWTPSAGGLWSAQNLKKVLATGGSGVVDLKYAIENSKLELNCRYGYSRTTTLESDISNDPAIGAQALYVPLNRNVNTITYSKKTLQIGVVNNNIGRRYKTFDNIESQSIAPYILFDVFLRKEYRVDDNKLFTKVSILNLNNNSYEGVSNRPMPGRSVYFTFVINFN